MSLPFLEAMGQTSSSGTKPATQLAAGPEGQPIRYAALFMPNGCLPGSFEPQGNTLDKLPDTLPLGEMSKHCNLIANLGVTMGGHTASTAGFLTGQKPINEKQSPELNIVNASVDQVIAAAANGSTPLSSLELALHTPRRGTSPSGLPWTYANHISWKNASTPVPQEINPMRAFLRLFEHALPTDNTKKKSNFQPGKKIVDLVLDDAKSLQRNLGLNDRQKLDEYLTSVSEVQSRITRELNASKAGLNITNEIYAEIQQAQAEIKAGLSGAQKSLSAQPKIPYPEYSKMMMDIMALAFWSNSTRVSTLMFGDGGSKRNMSFLDGVSGDHHSISHHGNDPEKGEQYKRITTYYVEEYVYLLKKLHSYKEGDSSVLDNSMIMFGSSFGNGQIHAKGNIPLIMAGSAGGRIKTNRYISAPGKRTNASALHRSVLDIMNVAGKEYPHAKKLAGFV